MSITLTINGEEHNLDEALTISALIEHLSIDPKQVAVERNLEIIPKSQHGTLAVAEGDTIEIVEFIGGG